MKRRIISSILVVVMLVLSLVSCGYSFQKDDMKQYMTFNREAFDAALESLDYADGDFTTNEDTRKEKIEQYIYGLLTDRVDSDAEQIKEGALSDMDKISYRYYATYEKDGEKIYVYPSRMASSTLDSISLGDTTLTGEKKAIREKVLELIKDGKLADVKGFIFTPKSTYTPDSEEKKDAYKEDTAAGTVAYITYTKTWPDGTSHEYKYERVTLGDENHFAAKALVGSKIGVKLSDDANAPRKNTENGVEYTYTSMQVNFTIPTLNEEILVEYKTPSKISLTKDNYVIKLDEYSIPADTVLTYHVNLAYFNEVEPISADIIMKELLWELSPDVVKDKDGNDVQEIRMFDYLRVTDENGDKVDSEELKAFKEALTKYYEAENAYDSAVSAVTKAKETLETAKKNNAGIEEAEKALKEAEDALGETVNEAGETVATAGKSKDKADAEKTLDEKLAAVYTKVNADVEQAKATIVTDFEKLVREAKIDEYNAEVKKNIVKALWKVMTENASVTSHPKKAIQEAYDRMFEEYQSDFYNKSNKHYKEHGGRFESYLEAEMKKHEDVPDAANFVTDYTQAKHALWYLAKQYVADIVIIHYVAELYEIELSSSELDEIKDDDMRFDYVDNYGEFNLIAAHQFDKIADHFLTIKKDADGKEMYDENGAPVYEHIKKKA